MRARGSQHTQHPTTHQKPLPKAPVRKEGRFFSGKAVFYLASGLAVAGALLWKAQQAFGERLMALKSGQSGMLTAHEDTSGYLPTHKVELLATHVHPGFQFVGNLGAACYTSEDLRKLKTYTRCEREARDLLQFIVRNDMWDQVSTETSFDNKGFTVGFPDESQLFTVAANPKLKSNYRRATRLAEHEMVQTPNFWERPTEKIMEVFKEIHKTLAQHNPKYMPGEYRNSCTVVFHDEDMLGFSSPEEFRLQQLRDAGASEADIRTAITAMRSTTAAEGFCDISEKGRSIWSKIATFVPHYKQVESLLSALVDRIKEMVARKDDPVAIAATAHTELVKIHPWMDGNGRFARLIMNAFLPVPVIFADDKVYTEAILKEMKKPGAFEDYLRNTAIPWNERARHILTS